MKAAEGGWRSIFYFKIIKTFTAPDHNKIGETSSLTFFISFFSFLYFASKYIQEIIYNILQSKGFFFFFWTQNFPIVPRPFFGFSRLIKVILFRSLTFRLKRRRKCLLWHGLIKIQEYKGILSKYCQIFDK